LIDVPFEGTIVPNMGTLDFLFPATRKALLVVIYGRPDEEFYLRELLRAAGKGHGVVQRELGNLVKSGVVVREKRKSRTYFRANKECPVYQELKNLVLKTAGLVDLLGEFLERIEGIQFAFVYGSVARGEEKPESDIDLTVIGGCSFADVVSALAPAQEQLGREINPTVYPPEEFKTKAQNKNHFIRALLDGKKIFVIGSERELGRLVQSRPSGQT